MSALKKNTEFIAVTHHESDNGVLVLKPVINSPSHCDFICDFVNSHGAKILGSKPQNMLGHKITGFLLNNKNQELLDKYQLVLNSKKSITVYEYRNTGIVNHFISEINGKVVDFIHLADNAWFRHDFQNQLELIQSSNDAFIVHDLNNQIVFWNRGAEKLYGWSESEVIGKKAYQVLKTKSPVPLKEIFNTVKMNQTWRGELTHNHKNGSEIVVDSRWELLKNDQILEVNRDITDQKIVENDLIHQRELFEKIINNIPVMITIFDPNKERFLLNNEFERVTGWTNDDAKKINLMEACYPEPQLRYEVAKFMDSLSGVWSDFPITTKTGMKLDTSWFNLRLMDQTMVGIGLDIHERKELERRKDDFINTASHELKTPITTIKAYAQLLKKKAKYSDEFIGRIENQVDNLEELVSDLLDTSKIQAGNLTLQKEKFYLDELIESLIKDLCASITTGQNIKFKNRISINIIADKHRISQVVTNLISNAIKYSPPKTDILIDMIKHDNEVTVSVQDFGVGIDQKKLGSIFDRFYQAGNQVKNETKMPSLGLGLFITSEIIKKHNGKLWVTSQKGKGTTFYFSLPTGK